MIKVSAVSMDNGYQDAVETAMYLGNQGLRYVVAIYQGGYIVSDTELDVQNDLSGIQDVVHDVYSDITDPEHLYLTDSTGEVHEVVAIKIE